MSNKIKNEEVAIFWGKFGVFITIGCFILGLVGGSIITLWVAADTQETYIRSILANAISEIDYNRGISWYQNERYIETSNYFSNLRTSALWQAYYNCGIMFGNDSAVTKQVIKCLDEIDWINRLGFTQYSKDYT